MDQQTAIKVDSRIEQYAFQAFANGIRRDQLVRFMTSGYVALEGFMPFHAAARDADLLTGGVIIALGGKRGPGKSHAVMAQIGLDDCQRYPGLKALFLRKVMKSAAESLEDLVYRVFKHVPHEYTAKGVTFANGSKILIGGYRNSADIEKYLGLEYDIIAIEEVTQIQEEKYDKMRGSLRSSKPEWRPRMYVNTNADGVGLSWFKRRIIKPFREGRQQETKTRFFDVSHIFNPFINQEYHEWLDSLKGSLRKAWRDGDWDAFAGMAFPMFNYTQHVIEPFPIPEDWTVWRALDWGSAAPFCCLWFAKDPDTRKVYVIREAYQAGLTTNRQAELVKDMTPPGEKILFTYADPALWAKQNYKDQVYSAAEEYSDAGITLTKADNDRLSGKRKIDNSLGTALDGLPGLLIFDTCDNLVDQLSNLPRDELKPEDVDTDAEDHAYDALRYGLTNEKRLEVKKPPKYIPRTAGVSVL